MFHRPDDLPPALPLSALHQIAWAELTHAYGAATDVPGQLEALAATDDGREKALDALYGNIFHQGTRFEAAAFTVPFLVGLLDRAELRTSLLQLLLHLAIGYEEDLFPTGYDLAGAEVMQFAEGVDNEWGVDMVHVHRQVAKGWQHYLRLLDDGTAAADAAHLLAYLPTVVEHTLPSLLSRMPGAGDAAWPSFALAVAMLSRGRSEAAEVRTMLDRTEPFECRIASTCAGAILGDASMVADMVSLLGQPLPRLGYWLEGATPTLIASCLRLHPGWLDGDAIDFATEALRSLAGGGGAWFGALLLDEAFAGRLPPPESAADLMPVSRQLLESLVDAAPWRLHGMRNVNWSLALSSYFLPSERNDLRRYLDGALLAETIAPGLREQLAERRGK